MKKRLIGLLILPACCSIVIAQNVGIGTKSPDFPLDVQMEPSGTVLGIRSNKDSTGAVTLMRFTTGSAVTAPTYRSAFIGNYRSASGTNLIFGTGNFITGAAERMRLSVTGNLGLGTEQPSGKLHINLATTTTNDAIVIDQDRGESTIQFRQSEVDKGVLQNIDNDIRIGTSAGNSSGLLLFRTAGLSRGAVDGTGRFGVGTIAPESKLHIIGGTDASAAGNGFLQLGSTGSANLVLDNNEILARDNGAVSTLFLGRDGSMVQIGNSTLVPGTKLYVTSGSDLDLTDANSGFVVMGSVGSTNIAMDNNEIQARNNGAAANLFLNYSGGGVRIGNGPFNSAHQLGVEGNAVVTGNLRVGGTALPNGYTFGVDGKIICTEVMVRLVANWPDYVFSDKYKLRSLPDLEQYILENKHLPGVPAATDIESKGLTLGEMQKLQMEKIEELTLYLIQLKKEMGELEQKLNRMKK